MARARARVVIAGLVQGVFFRSATARVAVERNVTGWVRNLPNGRVEALLEGEEADVRGVIQWCHRGPPRAEVEDVVVEWQDFVGEFSHFAVR